MLLLAGLTTLLVKRRIRLPNTLAVCLMLMVFLASAVADENQQKSAVPLTDKPLTEARQCTWACLKWTKLCNVDPRGVYKCRRTCANFGETCE